MKAGDLVAGRFQIEHLAGTGGMGEVYRARDRATDVAVALKVLLPDAAAHEERFVREAELLEALSHPAVVRHVAHGRTESGQAFLAMEWVEGVDLATRIEQGALSISETLALAVRVAGALGEAHARGIVHRDLKPENLLLPRGEPAQAKLLDFGVARVSAKGRSATVAGSVIGTPQYMAPEQARGLANVDARADIFSLGCVLFECLVGHPPFVGEHPIAVLSKVLFDAAPQLSELRKDVPEALDELVASMLAKLPTGRPPDGRAVEEALLAIRRGTARTTLPPPAPALTQGEQRLFCVVMAASEGMQRAALSPHGTSVLDGAERAKLRLGPLGAVVEQLAGGAIVATLAGGGTATDHVARGARVALALRSEVPGVTIALATGRGRAGGALPVGEAIDRAARLLTQKARASTDDLDAPTFTTRDTELPRPKPILIDAVTAGLLDVRFDVEEIAGQGPVLLHEHAHAEGVRTLLGRPTPCVGREAELGTLARLYDECAARPCARAALVIAPAGVGKSRVRYELAEILRGRAPEPQLWIARGDPMLASSPFGLIAPIVRRAAQIQDGEPIGVRRDKLFGRVARRVPGPERARVAEFLGELIGTPFPDAASVQLRAARRDPKLMGDQMRRAWVDLCAAESAAAPLVLLLDDLHFCDPPSLDLVAAALRGLAGAPILAVGLARPEIDAHAPRLWADLGAARVPLGELPRKSCERLVQRVLGDAASPKKVARIVEQAQGNALYLEELIRAVAEGQGDALPETVVMITQARLEHLAPEARRVLRAASVLGDVFWQGAVTEMVGGKAHAAEVEARIADLVHKELLTRRRDSRFPGEIEHVFRHALVREAAYAMLTDEDRETGHRIAGTWLEQAGETRPSVLAEHFDRGGLAARAVPFYVRAAKQALQASDLGAVLARTERGVALGAAGEERGRLLLAKAEAHRWREQMHEAEEAAEEAALNLREGSAAWCLAMGELVTAQGKLTERELMVATSRRLLDFAETFAEADAARRAGAEPARQSTSQRGEGSQPGTPTRSGGSQPGAAARGEGSQVLRMEADLALITAMSRAAIQAVYLGEGALARDLLGRGEAIATARMLDDPAILARHAQARGVLALYEGDMAGSARESERAIARYLLAGDLPCGCLERVNLGNAWTELGAYAEAEDETREALAAAERLGLRTVALAATINLGHILAMRGRAEEGVAFERSVLDRPAQTSARFEIAARLYLSRALEMAGRHAEAAAEAARVIDRTERVPPLRAYALATQARALLACGDAARAHAAAQQAMDLLTSLGGVDAGEALIRLVHAESLSAVGRAPEAAAALSAARERLLERAARIGDAGLRKQFLEVVPENARTMALAAR